MFPRIVPVTLPALCPDPDATHGGMDGVLEDVWIVLGPALLTAGGVRREALPDPWLKAGATVALEAGPGVKERGWHGQSGCLPAGFCSVGPSS